LLSPGGRCTLFFLRPRVASLLQHLSTGALHSTLRLPGWRDFIARRPDP
jgi:hypothetical protein